MCDYIYEPMGKRQSQERISHKFIVYCINKYKVKFVILQSIGS